MIIRECLSLLKGNGFMITVRKKTSIVSSWSRSYSPIDKYSLFIRHKEYHKQPATNRGWVTIHYSSTGVSIASSLVQQKQLATSSNFITTFAWFSERRPREQFSCIVLTFETAPKIQIHSNFDGCTSKFFLCSLSASFLAAYCVKS